MREGGTEGGVAEESEQGPLDVSEMGEGGEI